MNSKILLMMLFSFAAHLAVAAVIVYTPYDMIRNSLASHHDTVIWGYVPGGEQPAGKVTVAIAIKPVNQNKITSKGRSIPTGHSIGANADEIPLNTRLTENDKNPVGHPELVSGSQMRPGQEILKQVQNDWVERRDAGLSREHETSAPALTFAENGLAKGQIGETGIASMTSEVPDDNEVNKCSTPEDCGAVSITTGNAVGNSYDINALAEYIRKKIERYKYYPELAKFKGIEGTVYINFYIGQDGTPSSIFVARSSGSKILDDAGVKTIKMIGKISNLHKELRELDIVVPITYKLMK